MISQKNIDHMTELGRGWFCNCWGGTMFALGCATEPDWVDESDMEDFLDENTGPVTQCLNIGDVAVLRIGMELIHTAVYTGLGKWWHKMGAKDSAYHSIDEVHDVYAKISVGSISITYRRFNGGAE